MISQNIGSKVLEGQLVGHRQPAQDLSVSKPSSIPGFLHPNTSVFEDHSPISSPFKPVANINIFQGASAVELLDQTPSIRQLFNTDYKKLISQLVENQIRQLEALETNNKLQLSDIRKTSPTYLAEPGSIKVSTENQILMEGISIAKTDKISGDFINPNINMINNNSTNYDHLFHHQQSPLSSNRNREVYREKQKNKNKGAENENQHTYFDKKRKSKKDSLSQSLIRSAASALNTLAEKINNLA